MTGIEPASSAWEADILPMNYICNVFNSSIESFKMQADFHKQTSYVPGSFQNTSPLMRLYQERCIMHPENLVLSLDHKKQEAQHITALPDWLHYYLKLVTSVTILRRNNANMIHMIGDTSLAFFSNTFTITHVRIPNMIPLAMEYVRGMIRSAM